VRIEKFLFLKMIVPMAEVRRPDEGPGILFHPWKGPFKLRADLRACERIVAYRAPNREFPGYARDPVGAGVEVVVAQLVGNIQTDEDTGGESGGQPDHIDKSESLLFFEEMTEGDFEEIVSHIQIGRTECNNCCMSLSFFAQTGYMLKNYFTVAWRNLLRSKWYSLINTLGLSIGMAVALLIGLWIWDELSFDHYHTQHSRIAQILTTQTFNGETGTGPATSQPVGPYLRTHYPADFQEVARGSWNGGHVLAVGDKKITKDGMYVEPSFTRIITLKMVAGSADALKDPSTILLCESAAKALFDKDDPMNKTVKVDNKIVLKVGGVYADPPR